MRTTTAAHPPITLATGMTGGGGSNNVTLTGVTSMSTGAIRVACIPHPPQHSADHNSMRMNEMALDFLSSAPE